MATVQANDVFLRITKPDDMISQQIEFRPTQIGHLSNSLSKTAKLTFVSK